MSAPSEAGPGARPPVSHPSSPQHRNLTRRKALAGVTAVVVTLGIAWGTWWALALRHAVTTDNAYVQGDLVQITPQMGGTVIAIEADESDHVRSGQVLVRLDPADAKVALAQAEAQLAQAVRETRMLYANNSALQAQIAAREADLTRARSELARAQADLSRRAPLVRSGAVGREEFNHVKTQLEAARSHVAAGESALQAAREQLASNQALTDGTPVERHPNVLRAAARVREAHLALARAALPAPIDGYVAQRNVQLGQRVQAGAPLMSVVALDRLWVEANFKESQLADLRIGQPVTLTADIYGGRIQYRGTVQGLGVGTGAAFALLPAQNATGNWIKVVQRLPVRITLDPAQLVAHPLRVGLSMHAKVDVTDTSGPMLSAPDARTAAAVRTRIFDIDSSAADAAVARIVAANLGQPMEAEPPLADGPPAAGRGAALAN